MSTFNDREPLEHFRAVSAISDPLRRMAQVDKRPRTSLFKPTNDDSIATMRIVGDLVTMTIYDHFAIRIVRDLTRVRNVYDFASLDDSIIKANHTLFRCVMDFRRFYSLSEAYRYKQRILPDTKAIEKTISYVLLLVVTYCTKLAKMLEPFIFWICDDYNAKLDDHQNMLCRCGRSL